ncbi:MAG: DUF1345 domain-containing protein [Acidiferrobacter sp.]
MRSLIRAVRALSARRRLLVSTVVGFAVFLLSPSHYLLDTRLLLGWDAACLTFLAMAWMVMSLADAKETCDSTLSQDQSGFMVLTIAMIAASASFFAIFFLLGQVSGAGAAFKSAHLALSISAVVCSWFVVHTLFAFHYAHSFYRGRAIQDGIRDDGGIRFPGDALPHYVDFLYFSFVIGMTSQVSDVSITSHGVRRAALIHGILSFAFNTLVLALTINIVAGII